MDPITQKVLQRLNYEKLLITTGLIPRRTRITLDEIFRAAEYEPRVGEVLPGLVVFKPTAIARLNRDLPSCAKLKQVADNLFNEKQRPHEFMGIPTTDCAKAALIFKNYREAKKTKQKSQTITLRLSPLDFQKLTELSQKMGQGYSETIRRLVKEKNQV